MSSKTIYRPVGPTPTKIKNSYSKSSNHEYVPFVYLVKCVPTGQVYYGSRFAKSANPDLFFKNYFTSSKIVHKLIETYGIEQFEYQIRRTFKTADECVRWEQRVLTRIDAAKNPQFINLDTAQRISLNSETIFISNPVTKECIRIKKESPIPDGWVRGNINQQIGNLNLRQWFYDSTTNKSHHVLATDAEPHWIRGRGPYYKGNTEALSGKFIQITNGHENTVHLASEQIPDGWKRGRTKTQTERENCKRANEQWAGSILINNGTVQRRIKEHEQIPDGWKRGMIHSNPANLKTYINKSTGEEIRAASNPDSLVFVTVLRYHQMIVKLNKDLNRVRRYFISDTEVEYYKGIDVPTALSDTKWEYCASPKSNSRSKHIYKDDMLVLDHPEHLAIPLGWKLGNFKLKGKPAHNKNQNKEKVTRNYINKLTGEIITAEKNPDKEVWVAEINTRFAKGNTAPLKGRKAFYDKQTGEKFFLYPSDSIPDNLTRTKPSPCHMFSPSE